MTNEEKIANGECVSPMTTERCPHCIDTCEAYQALKRIRSLLKGTKVVTENKS